MGLSSSQARLLSLTGRMHDIEYKAQHLEAQKLQMANESAHVYKEYENALNATKIQVKQMSADGSSTYVDATYNNLLENGYYIQFSTDNKLYGKDGAIIDGKQPIEQADYDKYLASGPNLNLFIALENGKSIDAVNLSTSADGYKEIYTAAQLQNMTSGAKYRLMNDINVGNTYHSISVNNLTLDGNGHTISGLDTSLFDTLEGSNINNLNLSGDVIGSRAMLANTANNSNINNIKASGSVSSTADNTGGLIGYADNITVKNCEVKVDVSTVNGKLFIGGVFGALCNSTVDNCSAKGNLNGYSFVGGFSGTIVGSNVTNSTADTSITLTGDTMDPHASSNPGISYVDSGGFVGTLGNSSIDACEAIGSIENKRSSTDSGSHTIAGFVGSASANSMISNSNSYTNVIAQTDSIAGFIGYVNDSTLTVKNCNSYGNLSSGTVSLVGGFVYDNNNGGTFDNCYTSSGTFNQVGTSISNGTENTNTVSVTPPSVKTTQTLSNETKYTELYNIITSGNYYINDHAGNVADGYEHDNNWFTNMLNEGYLYIFKKDTKNGGYYQTNVATDTGLQEVSDEVNLKKAEAKYEADMRKIDAKDKKFDTDLTAMESERNAIKTEMDTLKNVAKDNVDRTFKLFS